MTEAELALINELRRLVGETLPDASSSRCPR